MDIFKGRESSEDKRALERIKGKERGIWLLNEKIDNIYKLY